MSEKPKKYWAVSSASGMHIGLWDDEDIAKDVRDEEGGRTILKLVTAPTVEQAARVLLEAIEHKHPSIEGCGYVHGMDTVSWLGALAGGKDHE